MEIKIIKPKVFPESIYILDGISKRTIEEHLKLYAGYVKKYNEIQEKLAKVEDDELNGANQVFSDIRELKLELSFAYGGVINHEIYFSHLKKDKDSPTGVLLKQIAVDFGSFEMFKKDLIASGMSARGWVWLGYNYQEKRLMNYIGDSQNTYLTWNVIPILALDVYEHAYFIDYGSARIQYLQAFLNNVNWSQIEDNFIQALK